MRFPGSRARSSASRPCRRGCRSRQARSRRTCSPRGIGRPRDGLDVEPGRVIEPRLGEVRLAHVELQVAEAVEVDDLGADLPVRTSGSGTLNDLERCGSISGPSSTSGMPAASCAVAGQSVSGARNDSACGGRITEGDVISTAAVIPPAAFHASESKPLSGPTRWRPVGVSTAISRSFPTVGSTTASTTAFSGM